MYLFALYIYLILKTTLRVRKYYLHFTDEETKAQRVIIKDPLINGGDRIQAPLFFCFLFTRMDSIPQNISPVFFKRKYLYLKTCVY